VNELSKIPPHNIEAEQSVLGSILIDKDAILKIDDFLEDEDFYMEKHRFIYKTMVELFHSHQPIDILTLTNLLETKDLLEKIGGSSYLAEITTLVPTSTHIFNYATIIKQKSILRKLIHVGSNIIAYGYEEDEKVEDLLEKTEKEVFSITKKCIKDTFVHIKDILDGRYNLFAELHESDDEDAIKGVPSGFPSLDHKLSGFQPADLVILAARPSMGKTALALSITINAALQHKKHIGLFSLEMSKEQLVDRMFCSLLGVDSWKLKKGKLDDEDFQRMGGVMDELSSARIYIDDSVAASIMELRTKARRLQMEQGLDMIVIDYLQLLSTGDRSYNANRVQEISEISRFLKAMGRELKIPILALSQLSRAVELRPNKRPQLSDLRDSGAIEQDADVVMMLYREDYYDPETENKGVTELSICKHRNGPTGKVELFFDKERMKFSEIDTKRQHLQYA